MEENHELINIEGDDRKDFFTLAKEAIGMIPLEVFFKKLDKMAVIPSYAHNGDVGMDFTSIGVEYDKERDMYVYHTGLAFQTEEHYGAFLFPRSSNRNTDAYLCNHVGIADTAIYRGEIIFCYKNRTSLEVRAELERSKHFFNGIKNQPIAISNGCNLQFTLCDIVKDAEKSASWVWDNPIGFAPYKVGDRIGQMVVLPYPYVKLIERMQLSDTVRGDNGFGSTGK